MGSKAGFTDNVLTTWQRPSWGRVRRRNRSAKHRELQAACARARSTGPVRDRCKTKAPMVALAAFQRGAR